MREVRANLSLRHMVLLVLQFAPDPEGAPPARPRGLSTLGYRRLCGGLAALGTDARTRNLGRGGGVRASEAAVTDRPLHFSAAAASWNGPKNSTRRTGHQL